MLAVILNALFRFIEWVVDNFILIFPETPFNFSGFDWPSWAQWIGIIIPFKEMGLFMSLYVAAVLAYYIVRTAARWIKVIGS